METGLLDPQGDIDYDSWQLEYENTLSSATTTVTISSLTGDTDEVYLLKVRMVNGYSGGAGCRVRINNDSGSNYGLQYLRAVSTSVSSARSAENTTYTSFSVASALGDIVASETVIYSKSGDVRTVVQPSIGGVTGTTVTETLFQGYSWNNTGTEITSLVIFSNQTNGLGEDTYISLYKKVD